MTDVLQMAPFTENQHYQINKYSKTHTQHLMHQLELFPVPFRQLEIGIGLSLKIRYFITIIRTLNKTVDCLSKAIRGFVRIHGSDKPAVEEGFAQGSRIMKPIGS
jgi:hypothetical protein